MNEYCSVQLYSDLYSLYISTLCLLLVSFSPVAFHTEKVSKSQCRERHPRSSEVCLSGPRTASTRVERGIQARASHSAFHISSTPLCFSPSHYSAATLSPPLLCLQLPFIGSTHSSAQANTAKYQPDLTLYDGTKISNIPVVQKCRLQETVGKS